MIQTYIPGADPGFQIRGGALKKIAPSGGRRENFWGISSEKSRFYPQKNHIFSNFMGGARRVPPPLNPPLTVTTNPIEGESPDSLQTDG